MPLSKRDTTLYFKPLSEDAIRYELLRKNNDISLIFADDHQSELVVRYLDYAKNALTITDFVKILEMAISWRNDPYLDNIGAEVKFNYYWNKFLQNIPKKRLKKATKQIAVVNSLLMSRVVSFDTCIV